VRQVWASVLAIVESMADVQTLEVHPDDANETARAIAYPALSGPCEVDDRVLLNTTAVDLALGTGGYHLVVCRVGTGAGRHVDAPSAGHIMKLRYTPLQLDVLSVEEQSSPHHEVMKRARSIERMPVACCGLHSQVPLVAAAVKQRDPALTVAYVMTDFAALPIALSGNVRACLSSGLLDTTITCGQAFGGRYEAVNLHSALLAARHVAHADVAIVAIGPGVVGTATPFGHGGVAQGEAINATASLGGVPVAALRVSFADERARHHGLSHHTVSALVDVALAPAFVAVPTLPEDYEEQLEDALEAATIWKRHTRLSCRAGRAAAPGLRGLEVRTMGRGIAEDPAFFASSFAAGEACARIARGELDTEIAEF
jgi:hypothetical protein